MSDRAFGTLAASFLIYCLVGVVTFGHAWHQVSDTEQHDFGGRPYTVHNGPGTKGVYAFVSSVAWPLYWSVKAWEKP